MVLVAEDPASGELLGSAAVSLAQVGGGCGLGLGSGGWLHPACLLDRC